MHQKERKGRRHKSVDQDTIETEHAHAGGLQGLSDASENNGTSSKTVGAKEDTGHKKTSDNG